MQKQTRKKWFFWPWSAGWAAHIDDTGVPALHPVPCACLCCRNCHSKSWTRGWWYQTIFTHPSQTPRHSAAELSRRCSPFVVGSCAHSGHTPQPHSRAKGFSWAHWAFPLQLQGQDLTSYLPGCCRSIREEGICWPHEEARVLMGAPGIELMTS